MRQTVIPLDPREERFVTLYVDNPNGTQAAIAAGYAPRSAHVTASRLLKRAKVRDAIARRNAELLLELDFTPQRIVREIAKVAAVNMADFMTIDEQGLPHIDMSGVKRRHLAAIASVENTDKGVKYKAHDKLKALDMLAKMARLYPADRTELTGADGGPIQSATVNVNHTMDIEALEPEQRDQLRQVLLAIKAQAERERRDNLTLVAAKALGIKEV
jgi:phage terminase small subunit